jgi:hypothetical protein
MSKRRNWLWIIFGICFVLIFIAIGVGVVTTAWVQQNVTVTDSSEGSALQQFDSVRARFAGRPPLLDVRDGRAVLTEIKPAEAQGTGARLEQMHVLVWDPDESKLASFAVPFWLLRLKSGPIEISSYASGWNDDRLKLRIEDIENRGPGIILDTTSRDGERVLVWAQ